LITIKDTAPVGEGDAYLFLAINPVYGNDEDNVSESGAVLREDFTLPTKRGLYMND
jgi:hypothetical protein